MNILLVSFFNSNNIGDTLIADKLSEDVEKYSKKLIKLDYTSGESLNEHGVEINKNSEKTGATCKKKIFSRKIDSPLFWYFYRRFIKKTNIPVFRGKVSDIDTLVIGGGNMIFDTKITSLSAEKFYEYVRIAKKNEKKVFAISIGLGPFKTKFQEEMMVKALGLCDYVTVRDYKSLEILRKHKIKNEERVYLSPDPVFSLPQKIESTGNGKHIGINVINNPEYRESNEVNKSVINNYINLINIIAEKYNQKILLFSTDTSDYEVIYDVFNNLAEKTKEKTKIIHVTTFENLLDTYALLDVLIGTRMHAMIIAYTQLIPIIGLSWQPKVEAMFELLEESESYFRLINMSDNIDDIVNLMDLKIGNQSLTLKMKAKLEEINSMGEKNIEILQLLYNQIHRIN